MHFHRDRLFGSHETIPPPIKTLWRSPLTNHMHACELVVTHCARVMGKCIKKQQLYIGHYIFVDATISKLYHLKAKRADIGIGQGNDGST